MKTSYDILVNKDHPLPSSYTPSDLYLLSIPFAPDLNSKSVSLELNDIAVNGRDDKYFLCKKAAEAAELLFQRAHDDDIPLFGVSGYRSYENQEIIYQDSLIKKGIVYTNAMVAQPGTSDHQTGLALDISIPSINYELNPSFGHTKEAHWLYRYASLYGFIIRYPNNKEVITGFLHKPWHIRYVTKPLSFYLAKTKMTLEQYHMLSNNH